MSANARATGYAVGVASPGHYKARHARAGADDKPPIGCECRPTAKHAAQAQLVDFRQVRPGDQITVVSRLEPLKERQTRLGPTLLTTYLIQYADQDGSQVAAQRNTLIRYR